MQQETEKSEGWKTLRVVVSDYEFLERRAKDQNLSIAACLHQTVRRERTVGAVRSMIEALAEQVRVLEQVSQRSASDITSRLRRIEADRSVKANRDRRRTLTPEGIPFEDYDRFQLLTLLTHVRDLAEHFVLDLATTAEERTEEVMDRLYCGEPATPTEDRDDSVAEEQHDDRER